MSVNRNIDSTFINIRELLSSRQLTIIDNRLKDGIKKDFVTLDLLLRRNLVELVFSRKGDFRPGFKPHRHMLCTRNFYLAKKLAKLKGVKMNVEAPRGNTFYKEKNILLVWDIVFNDWRMVSFENRTRMGIIDYVPFNKREHFVPVAEAYVKSFKMIKDVNNSRAKTYCNLIRSGV